MSEETSQPQKKYYDYISVGNRTKQIVYFVEQHDKPVHFELFLKENPALRTVVICKSKKAADSLEIFLKNRDIYTTVIHGNHRASQMQEASVAFNNDKNTLLITTSKIYENLELENVERILNYDLPLEAKDYFTTLRAVDETGESILFVNADDEKRLETIELMMKYEIPQEEIDVFTHTALPRTDKIKKKKPRHKKAKKTKQVIQKED